MKTFSILVILAAAGAVAGLALLSGSGCSRSRKADSAPQADFHAFLQEFEAQVAPLTREVNLASYESSLSGKGEDYARSADLQLQLRKLHADPTTFARLKAWKESGAVTDPLLARQLDVLYRAFLGNQLPDTTLAELVRRQNEIEKTFNTFRATLDGKQFSDNDLTRILRESKDPDRLREAWLASKEIGRQVAPAILELVRLRNEAARSLGFRNFQVMQLALGEQDPDQIERLFDQLDELTRDAFAGVKGEVDAYLARRLGLASADLRPWHYQDRFFQEAPRVYDVDLDRYYADKDLVTLAESYYAGIGLPIDDILARSDLYERPGKYQHAFSNDIDRAGDVRILCSLKPDQYWMNTLLHESGHGVYAKFNDPEVPWLLRDAAHAFTTEAVANLFGRRAGQPSWLQEVVGVPPAEVARIAPALIASQRLEQLVFSRWSQVMFRFEKAMYEDPEQDLDTLWWDLVERYQLLQRPEGRHEPDWAAKIHIALYPAYYHNYLLGELLASQLQATIGRQVLHAAEPMAQSFAGHPEVGRFLVEKVFKPGMTLPWNEMIARATGEELTPRYYAEQFVGPQSGKEVAPH